MLCTTEPQKLPQTILSRCMRLDFKRVPQNILAKNMRQICEERGVMIDDGALKLLASNADGSVRDGLSILDQVLASGDTKIEREDVLEYLGTVGNEFFIELTELVELHKTGEALVLLDKALNEGKDAKQLMKDWNSHYRNLLVTKFMKEPEDLLNMSEENIQKVKEQSSHISFDEIDKAIMRISKTINEARWSTQPRILMELDIVALSGGRGSYMREAVPRTETPEAKPAAETQPKYEPAEPVVTPKTEAPAKAPEPRQEVKPAQPQPRQDEPKTQIFDTSNLNLDDLWRDVMEEGEVTSGSFNLIRSWTRLKDVRQATYTVSVSTDFARKHVQEKMDIMDKIMSSILKRPMQGGIVVEKYVSGASKASEPDYAKEVKDALGLDIIVEE